MISLCTDEQKPHLLRLIDLVSSKTLSGTDAWSAFSSPSESKNFKGKGKTAKERTFPFSAEEVATYQQLRQTVKTELHRRTGGSCSYCRRPVGHYGWAWHIEHVVPKAKFPARTFDLSNLTVGCVHCNMWKGSRVDKKLKSQALPIINPVQQGFNYSDHLNFVQVGTESLSFAKYFPHSTEGKQTYQLLEFAELERAHAIDKLDGNAAALHQRITQGLQLGMSSVDGQHLATLLQSLKSSIYKLP